MRIVLDIEGNSLTPTKIWVVCVKDIDTGTTYSFQDKDSFKTFIEENQVNYWIAHNGLGFDFIWLEKLWGIQIPILECLDTLIISKLVDYPRKSHSIESYGEEFNLPKGKFSDWGKYSPEMEEYCHRDVDINHKIYLKYLKYISNPKYTLSIQTEHKFQQVVNTLGTNGFFFNIPKATELLDKVTKELTSLDIDILKVFPPRLKYIRTIVPKATKYGTISLTSIPKSMRENISELTVDAPFSYCEWMEFNPSSHKQIVNVLNESGWKPIDRTQTHIDTERELNQLKRQRKKTAEVDLRIKDLYSKLNDLKISGWKVNETNLDTLPAKAPKPARTIAQRILYEARRRTLTEWLDLVEEDGRIHGRFQGIGAWTHRMSHQNPNTANIPNELDTAGKKKLLGKELRSLWSAPKNRLLVGVDAEGIQLRIFAHYINDPEFTQSLVNGKKEDKSDPHSLNQRILGDVCKSRAAAKRYIYALLLGAGSSKLTEILGCTSAEAEVAYENLLSRYTGFQLLKDTIIPKDAERGWFIGLDGRAVRIPGDTVGNRRHLCMSGYLQTGEAVVMKLATLKWVDKLKDYDAKLVNFVHDEWQTECPNDLKIALSIAEMQANSLKEVGEDLGLLCPLAGSYYNDDTKDYTIDTNWSKTH